MLSPAPLLSLTPSELLAISEDAIHEAALRHVPPQYHFFFEDRPGVAPYHLLAYLGSIMPYRPLVEVGVHNGWGSLALGALQPAARVVGYDVDLSTLTPSIKGLAPQLTFREGLAHLDDPALLLSSPLIHLDALHDGVYEETLLSFLIQHTYQGWVLLDDIHLNPQMEAFWAWVPVKGKSPIVAKYDLTAIGHSTGTGLVCFGRGQG